MDEAVETYEAEIAVSRTANDLAGLVRAWSNLGITHGTLKSYQRAVECHSKALMVANDAQDRAVSALARCQCFGAASVLRRGVGLYLVGRSFPRLQWVFCLHPLTTHIISCARARIMRYVFAPLGCRSCSQQSRHLLQHA